MRLKKNILKIAIMLLMVFSLFATIDNTYAYWFTTSGNSAATTGTVTTGTWTQIFDWSSTATYNVGDVVFYNGTYWSSTKTSNANKTPSLSRPGSNWWAPYTP